MGRPAVFLDRDGVLNAVRLVDGRPHPPRSLDELELLPGVERACAQLRDAGLTLVMVTNQPDVARGTTTLDAVGELNDAVRARTGVEHALVCPHDDADGCACRKPRPGLLLDAARQLDLDLERSVMVGDRWRDVEAGQAAGVPSVFVARGYTERSPERPDLVVDAFPEALDWIMSTTHAIPGPAAVRADELTIKVFADGAEIDGIVALAADPLIKGFTTNPTLMRKCGVKDYAAFARQALDAVPRLPISFEVFADEPGEMCRQARLIAGWGENVYVKVPVTTTAREPTTEVVRTLAGEGVKLNVTGLMTLDQVATVADALAGGPPAIVSVFAGRIADAGVDPVPIMRAALEILEPHAQLELLWASPREIFNVVQADQIGCHIITATPDILGKLKGLGKDLADFSLETVKMFYEDARAAGYSL